MEKNNLFYFLKYEGLRKEAFFIGLSIVGESIGKKIKSKCGLPACACVCFSSVIYAQAGPRHAGVPCRRRHRPCGPPLLSLAGHLYCRKLQLTAMHFAGHSRIAYFHPMPSPQKIQETLALIDDWTGRLDHFSFEQLMQKPAPDQWSMAQVYIHLWMSSKGFFFKNVERCASKDDKSASGGSKTWAGRFVFWFRIFPPVKVKMPGEVSVQPHPPEDLAQLKRRMDEVKNLALSAAAKAASADPQTKVRHPFLGWLNAEEWFSLCGFHFKHHEAQIGRIRKSLGF